MMLILTADRDLAHWLALREKLRQVQGPLVESESDGFLQWLLDEDCVAKRPGERGKRQRLPMRGKHISRQKESHLRGSDFRERIYVAYEALTVLRGCTPKEACITMAELPYVNKRLGTSKRGRRSMKTSSPKTLRSAETIRSLVNKFESPLRHELLQRWVGMYRFYQLHQEEIRWKSELAKSVENLPKSAP